MAAGHGLNKIRGGSCCNGCVLKWSCLQPSCRPRTELRSGDEAVPGELPAAGGGAEDQSHHGELWVALPPPVPPPLQECGRRVHPGLLGHPPQHRPAQLAGKSLFVNACPAAGIAGSLGSQPGPLHSQNIKVARAALQQACQTLDAQKGVRIIKSTEQGGDQRSWLCRRSRRR